MRRKAAIVLAALLSGACADSGGDAPPMALERNYEDVTPWRAQELIDHGGVTVIDLRTDEEVAGGMLPSARQVNFLADDFRTRIDRFSKDEPALIYCRSGSRSSRANAIMQQMGFETIYHMDGGWLAWQEAGLPVTEPAGTE